MKSFLKSIVAAILGWQVRRLQKKNSFKTIAVVGAYGKTSTKLAIAELLESEFHVSYQKGNYNDIVTVPLVFFGHSLPSLFNPFAWAWVFFKNERLLREEVYPNDVVVLELGIDGPGQMEKFGKYLSVDWALVTSLGPEHMELFSSLDQVAREELNVQKFSGEVIVNKDLCPDNLLKSLKKPYSKYELDYAQKLPLDQWQVRYNSDTIRIKQQIFSKARMYSISGAAVMGLKLGLSEETIKKNIAKLKAFPGRMNVLKGKKGSVIIDDTYNASPEATMLALETLYSYPTKQRIALLGNMNELGKFSEKLHREIGKACRPGLLDAVVTLGPDANKYLADEAEKAGCKVIRTKSPYEAADKIDEIIKEDGVILAKGSQNGVFAEEAVKMLLDDQAEAKYLVRQTQQWLEKKERAFERSYLDD